MVVIDSDIYSISISNIKWGYLAHLVVSKPIGFGALIMIVYSSQAPIGIKASYVVRRIAGVIDFIFDCFDGNPNAGGAYLVGMPAINYLGTCPVDLCTFDCEKWIAQPSRRLETGAIAILSG
ncbi:hypothetical protein GGI25_004319 [Coemansia spiralis]|uniref:Uncharacterized protein n=1 Tax=Coemansia spiralis TaxID=417178 RepID=A0A9W8G4S1_9FUNG|nr:hypothetical protein GGI26_003078 [Coemansia sp. RSA 1358]KAJ2674580.1 hypothetical protein GGI25_004319 [Coemansia spiralis]